MEKDKFQEAGDGCASERYMDELAKEFDSLFQFEDRSELLAFTLEYRDIPMWPLIRNQIITDGIRTKYGLNAPIRAKTCHGKRSLFREVLCRNPFFSTHKDIVYVGFPSSNFTSDATGVLYDERIKKYYDVFKRSSMIVSVSDYAGAKYAYQNWKSSYAVNELAQKKKKLSTKDAQTLKKFVSFLDNTCPIKLDTKLKKKIYQQITMFSEYLEGYVRAWKLYLKITRPKLVVEYCGCFMGIDTVAMNLACCDMDIPTADIQVCWIGRKYHSYYCGNAILESRICRKIYPDYFFAWGEYWKIRVRNPCKAVTIGTHRKYHRLRKKNNTILICVSMYYESYIKYIDWIMNHAGNDAKIYLRLHPRENTASVRNLFQVFQNDKRFHFANDNNLQYYLDKCTYFVSNGSTVVFEALACGIITFVVEDDLYDLYDLNDVADRIHHFKTTEEFMELWSKRESMNMEACSDFFDMNYKKLFKGFMRSISTQKQMVKGDNDGCH